MTAETPPAAYTPGHTYCGAAEPHEPHEFEHGGYRYLCSGEPPAASDPRYEEEPCFDCQGAGCSTCNDTGMLYTARAIRLQQEAEDADES